MAHMFSSSSESWDREMPQATRSRYLIGLLDGTSCSALQANRLKNTDNHMQTIIGEFL